MELKLRGRDDSLSQAAGLERYEQRGSFHFFFNNCRTYYAENNFLFVVE
jgi:hypothetical protein